MNQVDSGKREAPAVPGRGTPAVPEFGNGILDALSSLTAMAFDRAAVRSIILQSGRYIGEVGGALDSVWFPQSALISAVMEVGAGERIDGVLIGSEGVFGAAAAFGVKTPVFSSVVQRAGTCWLMPASELRRLLPTSSEVEALLFRYQHFLLAQAQQIAACAAKHHIAQRFCSYLLRLVDDAGEVKLTQEQFARALGVQRTSISLVSSRLQSDGIIRNRRGRIKIMDAEGLRARACECHDAIECFKRNLLDPLDQTRYVPPC